jgi:hypothetical protein
MQQKLIKKVAILFETEKKCWSSTDLPIVTSYTTLPRMKIFLFETRKFEKMHATPNLDDHASLLD